MLSYQSGLSAKHMLHLRLFLQMLQRSWVQWLRSHGRGTRRTSAARWTLIPKRQCFGSEMASSCRAPTQATHRSTTRQPSATWRWCSNQLLFKLRQSVAREDAETVTLDDFGFLRYFQMWCLCQLQSARNNHKSWATGYFGFQKENKLIKMDINISRKIQMWPDRWRWLIFQD